MSTIEELEKALSSENVDRTIGDYNLKILISNEQLKRNQEDSKNKISISNRTVERIESDASIYNKMYDEIISRTNEITKLETAIIRLESVINANPEKYKNTGKNNLEKNNSNNESNKTVVETKEDKLMISQEMFVRQLNMLKRSGKFILDNAKPKVIGEDKDESVDFLVHLNNLQLTFDNLLANQNKYTLIDETKKCIKEAEELKIKLDELANKNWDVEAIVNDRRNEGRS